MTRQNSSLPQFSTRVQRRKVGSLVIFAAGLGLAAVITQLSSAEWTSAVVLGMIATLGMIQFVWVFTLDCPACRHPVFASEGRRWYRKSWWAMERCEHCQRTWDELDALDVDAPAIQPSQHAR